MSTSNTPSIEGLPFCEPEPIPRLWGFNKLNERGSRAMEIKVNALMMFMRSAVEAFQTCTDATEHVPVRLTLAERNTNLELVERFMNATESIVKEYKYLGGMFLTLSANKDNPATQAATAQSLHIDFRSFWEARSRLPNTELVHARLKEEAATANSLEFAHQTSMNTAKIEALLIEGSEGEPVPIPKEWLRPGTLTDLSTDGFEAFHNQVVVWKRTLKLARTKFQAYKDLAEGGHEHLSYKEKMKRVDLHKQCETVMTTKLLEDFSRLRAIYTTLAASKALTVRQSALRRSMYQLLASLRTARSRLPHPDVVRQSLADSSVSEADRHVVDYELFGEGSPNRQLDTRCPSNANASSVDGDDHCLSEAKSLFVPPFPSQTTTTASTESTTVPRQLSETPNASGLRFLDLISDDIDADNEICDWQ